MKKIMLITIIAVVLATSFLVMTHFYPNPKTAYPNPGPMLAAGTDTGPMNSEEIWLGVQMAANRVVKLGDSMNKPTIKFLIMEHKPIVKLAEIWGAKPKALFRILIGGAKPKACFGGGTDAARAKFMEAQNRAKATLKAEIGDPAKPKTALFTLKIGGAKPNPVFFADGQGLKTLEQNWI